MRRQLPSQTLEEQSLSPATRQAPLSESVRLGAQLMLQKVVEDMLGMPKTVTGQLVEILRLISMSLALA